MSNSLVPARLQLVRRLAREYGAAAAARMALAVVYARFVARPGRFVSVAVPGVRAPLALRARTSDVIVFQHLFFGRELDGISVEAPTLVIDAGANIGLTTAIWASRYPNATIVAIEVSSENAAVLRRNCAAYPNVRVIEAALWEHGGAVRIVNPDDEPWAFRVEAAPVGAPGSMPAVSVPEVLAMVGASHIDLLKLDIEGSELELLGDASREWLPRTRVLAIELHDRFRPGCSAALERAVGVPRAAWRHAGEYVVVSPEESLRASPVPPAPPAPPAHVAPQPA